MVAAFVVSLWLQLKVGLSSSDPIGFAKIMLIAVAITTVVWIVVTFATPPETMSTLTSFYKVVRPPGALWKPIAKLVPDVAAGISVTRNFRDWIAGCVLIYGALFGIGKLLLKEPIAGLYLSLAFIAALVIYRDLSRESGSIEEHSKPQ